ncbi:MAG: hypothetical protein IKJ11_04715 [Clostridia bacterium]|nr:hypothetical protein [Clostridia bacterium]
MLIVMEGAVMCFVLLLTCVIGIANGPAGLVVLYEQNVQDRAVELGLTTKKRIRRNFVLACIALFVPSLILPPLMVYGVNGASGFWAPFWQMTVIQWIAGLFDRFFIDWYWVGRTKAWLIPGTEDLMPYIPVPVCVRKWMGTIFVYPILSAVVAGIGLLV